MYTLYGTLLGPGVDDALARLTVLSTSFHFGGFSSIWCSGCSMGGISDRIAIGACLHGSEGARSRCSSMSYFEVLRVPPFFAVKGSLKKQVLSCCFLFQVVPMRSALLKVVSRLLMFCHSMFIPSFAPLMLSTNAF